MSTPLHSSRLYAQKTLCSKLFKRACEGLYNGNVLLAHLSLYSSVNRLYAQNPVFEIVHDESVKVYLHMYNGNVRQEPSMRRILCD